VPTVTQRARAVTVSGFQECDGYAKTYYHVVHANYRSIPVTRRLRLAVAVHTCGPQRTESRRDSHRLNKSMRFRMACVWSALA
jgi:hypothetical protein